MIFNDLKCGRRVHISHFHYSRTYGGLLEGRPDEEMNNRILRGAVIRMQSIFGKRKTHLILPKVDMTNSKYPTLPSTELTAWLTCDDSVNEKYMGSETLIVWYLQDKLFEECTIREATSAALHTINWSELAQDYDW